ncbi:MAG: hypothetical protein IJS74_02575 [Clostridia bacterium]|nr:hypothetical protein [Clostridia bacterium]
MKKLFKSILSLTIAFVLVLPLLVLAGCSKKYTITVAVKAGEGQVLLQQQSMEAGSSTSVVGKNSVAEGEKFEFLVSANAGYKIKSIKEDGVLVEADYSKTKIYRSFVDVKANHKVEVEFEKYDYTVTIMCKNEAGTDYVQYGDILYVKSGDIVDFNANIYGGANNTNWFVYKPGSVKEYLFNGKSDVGAAADAGYEANIFAVRKNWTVYTDLKAAEIPAVEAAA